MERGYIKLWRKITDSGLLQNSELLAFWVWCLTKATHKKRKVMIGHQEIELNQGEFVFGRRKAAQELNLSERKVRTCIKSLKLTNRLTIKTTNKFSIVSIVKWNIYQPDSFINDQLNDQLNDQPVTSKRPASDQQVTTNKNKRTKNNKPFTNSMKPKTAYTNEFEQFWAEYPKRIGKINAFKAWQKQNGDRPEINFIIQKIIAWKKTPQWTKENGQYVPNPQTWINRGGWDDEINITPPSKLERIECPEIPK